MITPQITAVGQISINAKDLARATDFYKNTLGLPHLFNAGNMSFFDCGGIRLMLATADKPEYDHPGSIIYYKVGDIEGVSNELEVKGVKFERKPFMVAKMPNHELWMAFLRDSEGNLLAFMAEKPL